MDENWYSAEQEIRDRMSQAREAARVRCLIRELTPPPSRQDSVRAALMRWATRILARAPGRPAHSETTYAASK